MPMHPLLVAQGQRAASRAVVAANGQQPILARFVLFAQNSRSDREIAIGVQQLTGLAHTVPLVADVELAEADIDAGGWHLLKCTTQSGAGFVARSITVRCPSHVQGPGPGNQVPQQYRATLLQR